VEVELVCDKNTVELQDESNERLEFLGDQITNSIIVYYLFQRFPTEQEGFLTKLKTNLISTRFYARFARYLDLGRFMIVSRFVEEQANGRNSEKLLENLFESFMGALFLDFSNVPSVYTTRLNLLSGPGYEICEKLVHHLLNTLIDFDDLTQNDRNFKDILLRYYQATFGIVPRYCEISSEGPPNNRIFTMGVYDADGNIVGRGSGNSKKKGEQEASLDALKHYGAM
jgi:ribonuclease-3